MAKYTLQGYVQSSTLRDGTEVVLPKDQTSDGFVWSVYIPYLADIPVGKEVTITIESE